MGPANQALWLLNGIKCSRHSKIKNSCPHPSETNQKLYFALDSPHVFKNMRLATEGQIFYLSDEVVKRFHLPSNIVNLEPVKTVISEDTKVDLKAASRLKENIIKPGHFDKIKVGYALALINRDVATGIKFYIDENKIDKKSYTTAWFFEMMHKWFCIMNCRSAKLAISHNKEEEYSDTISFLKDIILHYPTSTRRHGNFAGVHTLLRILLSSNSAVLINIITGVSPPQF
jgi:hypothetical protein